MSESSLEVVIERRVARIALNRSEVHNAFDDRLIGELTAAPGERRRCAGYRTYRQRRFFFRRR